MSLLQKSPIKETIFTINLPNTNALSVIKNTQKNARKSGSVRERNREAERTRTTLESKREREAMRDSERRFECVIKNTHFNTLQHTATNTNALSVIKNTHFNSLQHTATHCNKHQRFEYNQEYTKNALKSNMHDHRG